MRLKKKLTPILSLQDVDDEDLELMPVPASYNDISTKDSVRDHLGVVTYQRSFIVPYSWAKKVVWMRFGSVCYAAKVVGVSFNYQNSNSVKEEMEKKLRTRFTYTY